jgi:hypothetical protein
LTPSTKRMLQNQSPKSPKSTPFASPPPKSKPSTSPSPTSSSKNPQSLAFKTTPSHSPFMKAKESSSTKLTISQGISFCTRSLGTFPCWPNPNFSQIKINPLPLETKTSGKSSLQVFFA